MRGLNPAEIWGPRDRPFASLPLLVCGRPRLVPGRRPETAGGGRVRRPVRQAAGGVSASHGGRLRPAFVVSTERQVGRGYHAQVTGSRHEERSFPASYMEGELLWTLFGGPNQRGWV